MTKKTKTQDALAQRVKLSDDLKTPLAQMLFDEENLSCTLTSSSSSNSLLLSVAESVVTFSLQDLWRRSPNLL